MIRRRHRNMVLAALMCISAIARAPQSLAAPAKPTTTQPVGWRNDGSGRFPSATPPLEWSETHNVIWKTRIGANKYSSPIAVNGRVFLVADPDVLVCVDASSGKILWRQSNGFADLPGHVQPKPQRSTPAGNATPTPVCDGRFVYTVFGNGIVACYDVDGRRQWIAHFDLKPATEHGRAASPVLAGGKLLVTLSYLFAIDAANGSVVWNQKSIPELYGTPLVTTLGGKPALIMPTGHVVRVDDGAILAQDLGGLNFASPIFSDNVVFLIQTGAVARRLSAPSPEKLEVKQLWDQELEGTFYASAVLDKSLIYAVSNENRFHILDARDGKILATKDLDFDTANMYPSLVLAGNHLFVLNDQGDTLVLEPGPQFKEIKRNHLGEGHGGTPAFEGKRIYMRSGADLYCIGEP